MSVTTEVVKEGSRTENSLLNASMSIAYNAIGNVLGFINRIVLTHTLSATYVGINGLFLELLKLLSFSQLGISMAMSFSLYRPLAEHDIPLLQGLARYYKKLFYVVGTVVLCIGLCLVPAFPVLLKNGEEVPHLRLAYMIYLGTNVSSYPLLYKRTFLIADQKGHTLGRYFIGAELVQYIVQIAILLVGGGFTLYVFVGSVPMLVANMLSARKVARIYPFLCVGKIPPLSDSVRKNVNRNAAATTMQKIGTVLVDNTDILILSSMIGVVSVAKYSNYNLVCRGIDLVLASCFKGIADSVGNLNASTDGDKYMYKTFHTTFFINQWLYGFSAICLYELLSTFVFLCFGAEYVFPNTVVLILCINVYMKGIRLTAQTFHDSMGLYWHDRYRTLVEAGINLVVSIILARWIGVAGVFVGTLLSNLATTFWMEPYVLFKNGFHAPVRSYFLRYGIYGLVVAAVWFITDICCKFVGGGIIVQFLARALICLFVPNTLFLVGYFKTEECRSAMGVCRDFYDIFRSKFVKKFRLHSKVSG